MKKSIFLILLFPIFIFSVTSDSALSTEKIQGQGIKIPTLTEIIQNNIDDAHESLSNIQDLFKNIPTHIKKASFTKSLSIAIEEDGVGGIWFDFGYLGHGLLNKPFSGFETRIDFEKVPDWLEGIFRDTLVKLGFGRIINVSSQDEFLIKFILLILDKKNQEISSRQFVTELFFIFYRLALVEDFEGMDSLLKSATGPFAELIGKIKVNNKPLTEFLNKYWDNFNSIVNYDFAIENKSAFELTKEELIESNDWETILKISFSISLKTCVEYYVEREKFINTDDGKQLFEQISAAQTKKEKLKKLKEFNNAMPGYNKIVTDTRNRLKGFLTRIKGIRTLINKFREKLKPLLDPFFDSMGLPLDLVWPELDNEGVSEVENLYEDEEFVFEDDPFGSDNFEFEEF